MLAKFKSFLTKALNVPLSSPAALDIFGVPPGASGIHVDALTALRVPAIQQGVRLISESVATLDAQLFMDGHGGRELVKHHPVASILTRPNPWYGETELKRQLIADYLLWGNGLALVSRVRGDVRELHRIDPRSCSIIVDQITGEPRYSVALQEGGTREFSYRDVIHLRNTTLDGARGLGLVNLGAEAIGLALILEHHASGLFSRGARPAGILEIAGRLSKEALERLRIGFSNIYVGTENAGRTAILEQGAKFTPLQLSSVDAQFLEMRKFQTLEIARLLNIPAVLLNDLEHATLSNAEHLAQQFLDRTISPIIELFEDAIERTLLTEDERAAGYCIEFDTTNFARADIAARFASYKSGIESGVLLLNEARDREGLPPVEGGDTPMRSVQTIPLAPDAAATQAPAAPARESSQNKSAPRVRKFSGVLFHGAAAAFDGLPETPNGWAWFSPNADWAAKYGPAIKAFQVDNLHLLDIPFDPALAHAAFTAAGINTSGGDWNVQESYRVLSDDEFGPIMAERVIAAGYDGLAHIDRRYAEGNGAAIALTSRAFVKLVPRETQEPSQ